MRVVRLAKYSMSERHSGRGSELRKRYAVHATGMPTDAHCVQGVHNNILSVIPGHSKLARQCLIHTQVLRDQPTGYEH